MEVFAIHSISAISRLLGIWATEDSSAQMGWSQPASYALHADLGQRTLGPQSFLWAGPSSTKPNNMIAVIITIIYEGIWNWDYSGNHRVCGLGDSFSQTLNLDDKTGLVFKLAPRPVSVSPHPHIFSIKLDPILSPKSWFHPKKWGPHRQPPRCHRQRAGCWAKSTGGAAPFRRPPAAGASDPRRAESPGAPPTSRSPCPPSSRWVDPVGHIMLDVDVWLWYPIAHHVCIIYIIYIYR